MKKILQRIHDVIEDLNRWQFIPANFEAILEERLFLVCKLPDRLKREKTPRSRSEYNSHARRKRAREIYLEVPAVSPLNFHVAPLYPPLPSDHCILRQARMEPSLKAPQLWAD